MILVCHQTAIGSLQAPTRSFVALDSNGFSQGRGRLEKLTELRVVTIAGSLAAIIFTETKLRGAFLIDLEKHADQRGFFARTYCEREFNAHKLNFHFVQCNTTFNKHKGTLRGMHFQVPPNDEAKLIRCTRGAIYDAIIDLRPESATFRQYFSALLSAENGTMLYVPHGFAHGFQTLEDNTEVFYQMSQFYAPEHARGVRWNDPAFGIKWPADERIILDRDQSYPDFIG